MIKCYSVRLQSLVRISDKAFKATSFDGNSDIIPSSCIFGQDFEVTKSDAYWIAAWILPKKNIQYSGKKVAFFTKEGKRIPTIKVETIVPKKIETIVSNEIDDLKR